MRRQSRLRFARKKLQKAIKKSKGEKENKMIRAGGGLGELKVYTNI